MLAFKDKERNNDLVYVVQLSEPLIIYQGNDDWRHALPTDWLVHRYTTRYPEHFTDNEFRGRFSFAYNDEQTELIMEMTSRDDCNA